MKLWCVTAEIEFVVVAEDEDAAYAVANDSWHEVRREQEPLLVVMNEITIERELPDLWTTDCLPYGGETDKEIGDYLDGIEHKDTKTVDMFESDE